jgi:hypothetical protein
MIAHSGIARKPAFFRAGLPDSPAAQNLLAHRSDRALGPSTAPYKASDLWHPPHTVQVDVVRPSQHPPDAPGTEGRVFPDEQFSVTRPLFQHADEP